MKAIEALNKNIRFVELLMYVCFVRENRYRCYCFYNHNYTDHLSLNPSAGGAIIQSIPSMKNTEPFQSSFAVGFFVKWKNAY